MPARRGANAPQEKMYDPLNIERLAFQLRFLENRRALWQRTRFGSRAAAIELIETHIIDRIAADGRKGNEAVTELGRRAGALTRRLERANAALIRGLERQIVEGSCRGPALREELLRCAGPDGARDEVYGNLDLLLSGLLHVDKPPLESGSRDPEMVPYQPTPARRILDLIDRAGIGPDDVFYDVGSGLGQVPILVSLLTEAQSVGIEAEPAYCEIAQRCAQRLNVPEVRFANVDARQADYAGGTVYYLYTPCRGKMLAETLGRLAGEAAGRRIRICTLGPCTETVSRQPWLTCLDRAPDDPEFELGVFAGG